MKKGKRGELRSEYSRSALGAGVRGKYAKKTSKPSSLVLLKPEIAAAFPTDRAVNKALADVIKAKKQKKKVSTKSFSSKRKAS